MYNYASMTSMMSVPTVTVSVDVLRGAPWPYLWCLTCRCTGQCSWCWHWLWGPWTAAHLRQGRSCPVKCWCPGRCRSPTRGTQWYPALSASVEPPPRRPAALQTQRGIQLYTMWWSAGLRNAAGGLYRVASGPYGTRAHGADSGPHSSVVKRVWGSFRLQCSFCLPQLTQVLKTECKAHWLKPRGRVNGLVLCLR